VTGTKGCPGLLHCLVEQCSIFCRQVQEADDFIQLLFNIGGAFAGDGQVEAGAVVRQNHAIAVIDQSACGGDRQDVDTIVFRDCRVVVKLDHFQDIHAHDQRAGNGNNEQGARHQSFVDQTRLFFVVLYGYRLGHFCSSSLTKKGGANPYA
jgi:hypothetical protein